MSGTVVNLRRARKARARAEADRQAVANRAEHGVPAALRRLGEAEEERRTAALDAHRREVAPDRE